MAEGKYNPQMQENILEEVSILLWLTNQCLSCSRRPVMTEEPA